MVLPLTNPTPCFWIEGAESPLRNHRTTEVLPEKTDVVIIGSGYSGATIAYYLSKFTDKPPGIVMLEARDICGGATGRNGGQLKPDWYISYPKWTEKYGRETALSLSMHERSHLAAFTELLKEEPIECSFRISNAWEALMTDVECQRAFGAYDTMIKGEGEECLEPLKVIREKLEAERVTTIRGAVGAINIPAGQIWPYKFVHGLLQKLLDQKIINLQAHTPATEVTLKPDSEGYVSVTTPRGIIRAKRVVHATNRWASHLLPEFDGIINAHRATLCAIKASPHHIKNQWGSTISIRWDGVINNYLCQFPPPLSTIVIGGAKEILVKDPSLMVKNDREDLLIPGVKEYFQGIPKRDFIGWDGPDQAELEVAGVWTGTIGTSVDAMPFVGPLPGSEKYHFVQASFCGHGMPRILGSSAYTVPLILESLGIPHTLPSSAKHFPPLPEPFKVTAERLDRLRAAHPKEVVDRALELANKNVDGGKGLEIGVENLELKGLAADVKGGHVDLVQAVKA